MATSAELDAQWEAQYQIVLAKRQALTAAQTLVAQSAEYINGTEAERNALSASGDVEAARLAFNAENQRLTSIASELKEAKAAEAKVVADEAAAAKAAEPTSTIKSPEATNESKSDADTAEKYADTTRIPDPSTQVFDDGSSVQTFDDGSTLVTDSEGKISSTPSIDVSSEEYSKENRSGVPAGAERSRSISRASAEWAETKDLRVIIRTPKSYLKGLAAGPSGILNDFGGILFPYTPSISYDNQAVYGTVNPVHSNYTQYFYKNSQVGPISITGKFTVQNEKEGKIWLGIVHLLRSLTKMRWGSDTDAGSPPPVCRLEAYGDFMLRNVPVVIANFKFDLPDNVDYMAVKGEYKNTLVPTISTLSVTLNPMYSRREMQDFSVDKWIKGDLRGQGYL